MSVRKQRKLLYLQCELKTTVSPQLSFLLGLKKIPSIPSLCWVEVKVGDGFDIHKGSFSKPGRNSTSQHT